MQCQYSEERVDLNGVVGTLGLARTATPAPAVLLLHGFASDKDEVGGLYAHTAHALGERGIGSLRIDFRGWGESEGDMADTTVPQQTDDALMAYRYLAGLETIDERRLGVLGFSLGAAVAINLATRTPVALRSLVVWSCGGSLEDGFKRSLGLAAFTDAEREGVVTLSLPWREVRLKSAFFESLRGVDTRVAVRSVQVPVLAIAGSADSSSSFLQELIDNASADVKRALLIPGADHIYGVLDPQTSQADEVVQASVRWFEQTL